jgi:ATP-binding cassette subfamily B protein/subfamily B ATP-binding cassette protein MsbA
MGWLRLARYARGERRRLWLLMLLMLLNVGLDVLKPWPMKVLVDHVLSKTRLPEGGGWLARLAADVSPTNLLAWSVAAMVLLYLVGQAVRVTRAFVQMDAGNRMVGELAADLFVHLQRLSLRFHSQQRVGDLVRRVTNDCGCVRELVVSIVLPVLTSVVMLVTMFGIMWRLDSSLSLVAVLAVGPLAILIKLFAKAMTDRGYEQHRAQGELMAFAEQTLTALPVVQAFTREEHEDRRFRDLSQRNVLAYLRAILSQLGFKVGTGSVTALGTAALMLLGGLRVLHGSLSIGELLVFLAYVSSLYAPLETLAYASSGSASATAGARRVLEVLEAEDQVREAPGARALPATGTRGQVRVEGVTFGYDPGRPVLRGITVEARPGEMVALVGPTGAGKSTLVALIPRFFDPWEGRVSLDGLDVRELRLASLRAQVALVLQEPFLLPLTVAENIGYGRPGASRAEIVAAAEAANADEFIRRLPQGYESEVGERGVRLSGGERQRIAIARAFLKDAPVLILDEPTSLIDSRTELGILDALERLMVGRTTFTIAHRLSTTYRADQILVMDKGRIVERGTHDELIRHNGLYARLYRIQSGALRRRNKAEVSF